ncbi:endolytic transglycosylase MltG [Octadecabacter sp. 1_MG-2023]|uniref:endolytic transglycosylase MltG n=1 Tax=unclassified Octadecabacter TaxID=196158 RepID=UPI001C0A4159|nr:MULTISPECIES: endolytic transglycosylase MltG [unclassified Octadecabacter]MBU2993712.1 endolytic transglycosylase MltG [Octadecabacter sp. B2R22]MDO6735444.1 endolytic transglycosylase MltG [Octadecabacter sp. 1_MG-2023]
MWKHIAANALTFFIVALFLFAGVIAWGTNEYSAEGPLEQAICLQVRSGSNMRIVSESLAEQDAISSPALFRIGVDYANKASQLKAGSFLVPVGASMEEIVDIVTRGGPSSCGTQIIYRVGINRVLAEVRELDPATGDFVELAQFNPSEEDAPAIFTEAREASDTQFNVVFAEGVTSWQVVQALNSLDVMEGSVNEIPAEGMLAPDSYQVQPGDSVAELLDKMEAAQTRVLADAWESRADGLPLASPEEALILASIIEKEASTSDERFDVASVFINRLNQGMRLQTDPTVIYGVTLGEGVLGRGLRQSELRAETPWNTYVIEGLPQTPIANPGRGSIEAALNPSDTDFIFFVAKTLNPRDGHNFAVTLDEHNANVAIYRRLEAERAASGDN